MSLRIMATQGTVNTESTRLEQVQEAGAIQAGGDYMKTIDAGRNAKKVLHKISADNIHRYFLCFTIICHALIILLFNRVIFRFHFGDRNFFKAGIGWPTYLKALFSDYRIVLLIGCALLLWVVSIVLSVRNLKRNDEGRLALIISGIDAAVFVVMILKILQ